MTTIIDLPDQIANFSPTLKKTFSRIYDVSLTLGELVPPESMHPWIKGRFGSVDRVCRQRILRVDNLVSMQGTLFNELRAMRPREQLADDIQEQINRKGGPFDHALENTPEDTFGRIKSRHSVTASNITKYDGWHGVTIFKEHNPLKFTRNSIVDAFGVAAHWSYKAHQTDPDAMYPYIMWNCLWRAAASVIHGHAQMNVTKKRHYLQIEHLRKLAADYKRKTKANYFKDLWTIHKALGLGIERPNAYVIVKIDPLKEKEIWVISKKPGYAEFKKSLAEAGFAGPSKAFREEIFNVAKGYRDKLGVESFNMGMYLPPFKKQKAWEQFPIVARFIDRERLSNKSSEIGGMELFSGNPVVASDPFAVHKELKKVFK